MLIDADMEPLLWEKLLIVIDIEPFITVPSTSHDVKAAVKPSPADGCPSPFKSLWVTSTVPVVQTPVFAAALPEKSPPCCDVTSSSIIRVKPVRLKRRVLPETADALEVTPSAAPALS
jgi:hypothetical protein